MKKIPKLRFKEFSDEWEEKTLGEISENISYGLNAAAIEYDGKNKYIRITDIDEENRNYKPNPLTSPSGELSSNFLVKENDILFARTGASVGKSYHYEKNDGKLYFAGFLIRFNIYKENSKFIFYNTLRKNYSKWVSLISKRTGQPGINAEEYKIYKLFLPTVQEQEKIGKFLSSVDKKIILTEEKLELYRQYKKGVMQKLFSQEMRFKDSDGNDYPDWEERKLEDIVNITKGQQINKEFLEVQGKYPVINGGIFPSGYIDKYNVLANTITISEGGNSCGYINFIKENFWAGGHCYTLNKIIDINYHYLYHILKFNEKSIMDLRVGTGLPNIQKNAIINYKIYVSTSLEEQEKIAGFLSSIDEKIEGIEKELEGLKEFKKGLLQKMFV